MSKTNDNMKKTNLTETKNNDFIDEFDASVGKIRKVYYPKWIQNSL